MAKKGCAIGENTGAFMAKSETIPSEGEAEYVADPISKEEAEKFLQGFTFRAVLPVGQF
jgi:hypothetical protein